MHLSLTALAIPLIYTLAGLACLFLPDRRRRHAQGIARVASLFVFVAQLLLIALYTASDTHTSTFVLIDGVTLTMTVLIGFLGLVITRYSATALRDEAGSNRFLGWMGLTLAAVLLLVQAGTLWMFLLAWVGTSLAFRQLLLFYRDRPLARKAARRKDLSARAADLMLAGAFVALWISFGTAHIATITSTSTGQVGSWPVTLAAALIAGAAILKSAQFPFHGWLTQVMEAPTPVSALLHAGLVNAGGFLLIRFSPVLVEAPGVLAMLVAIGGFTALAAGLVMLTQPAVKTSLAWSTIAQMGFMVMQCGLGLFAFALLHIAAHSLYKAHAFLSSGQAVENVAAARRPGPVAVPSIRAVGLSFLLALAVFAMIATLLGAWSKPPQALALGVILVFGVAYMFAQGLADSAPRPLMRRTMIYAGAITLAYFALQDLVGLVAGAAVPPVPQAGSLEWALICLALFSFGAVAFAQALFAHWASHPTCAGLRVHFQNGLYADLLLERAITPLTGRKEA
jgi:NAD(P)H-quinone oxidoreductase subunit 5